MKKSLLIFLITLIVGITLTASDVILSNTLGAYYCAQEPNPKTYIKHTVEEPISIYWEDNIYPGFDDADAKLMVQNYLDGARLQTMALNTPDRRVKVYSYANVPQSYIDLVKEGYAVTKEAQEKRAIFDKARNHKNFEDYPPDFNQIRDDYFKADNRRSALTKQIEAEKAKLDLVVTETTKEQMSQMNYTVKTDEVHLSDMAHKVLYCDEINITDNRTHEVIAYDRRIMKLFSALLLPDFAGGRYYEPYPQCGGQITDRNVFPTLRRGAIRHIDINQMLFKKYQK